ncbi:conserved hypothetical protein [Desulfofarcimen acetoxidans DSM 771]|uniref:DUF2229 domain-containing protein n=1 Tax=Desulfofarcimen acetoxidans (strain ATCC 49208 / DSM 771 / KCTC 5769 / VKM B-1644 / 5575) TaxID=485916 RepID=C8VYZ3_DESAS|nr:conserved hypothetical protein [Desulfofarcimen acetoxidans DSM 771]
MIIINVKVGIPRALLYYYLYPLWKVFFNELGVEVVLSPPTNKKIIGAGLKIAVDDTCLPVKVALGHVQELVDKVDYLFVPRLVSISPREYVCPKFLGLPDITRYCMKKLPSMIAVNFDNYKKEKDIYKAYDQIGRYFTNNPLRIRMAYWKACQAQKRFWFLMEQGCTPEKAFPFCMEKNLTVATEPEPPAEQKDYKVAVIGHPYNIYDSFISMNIMDRLKAMGIETVTADNISEQAIRQEASRLPKKLFWTLGLRMIGAAYKYLDSDIDGLIHISAFGCGPDSMSGDLIDRQARRVGKIPFLNLTLDEHTGEAGVVTRLEAFTDMVKWRRALA